MNLFRHCRVVTEEDDSQSAESAERGHRDGINLLGADVEESGDGAAYAVGLIVDEGIEETGVAVQGDDIVVGDGCRNQGAMALPENNFMVHGEGFMVHGEGFMVQGKGFMVQG